MTPTLLVSFHGGSAAGSINNVVAFAGGNLLAPGAAQLSELRKFLFSVDGDYLYVANGYKQLDQVLGFTPPATPGDPWPFAEVYAADQVSHPFDLVFGFGGALFVSNQDSNEVTSYREAGGNATVFAGGFQAVRGLACDGTNFYAADSGAGEVVTFDSGGTRTGSIAVDQPVHLLYDPTSRWLFIGTESDNAVMAWNPRQPNQAAVTVVSNTDPAINHTGGIALQLGSGSTATMYVASRVGQQVLSFPLDFSSGAPVWQPKTTTVVLGTDVLTDNPEFVGIQFGLYG